ncbi:hypothetical protein W97_09313 [Coniosporium apollinis CBS 100218]|uniref:Cytochrome P450 n=1 Tax=Coniosporium apollinis (strain CBS 100218) TaxID=1168221 RepID=R7Z791_CONA1|nr:uncharacterized protein W97_09313 [Coniosporium apollinis CBS 100218]EON70045.1 hypothetical protein W97_09313 [Coniosporium apollinis CBS 100218]
MAALRESVVHDYLFVALAAVTILCYVIGGAIYRLYFSPLSKFPGPKLAAITLWYEFYYDVIKKGQYTFEIGRMHEEYGPIVRISPHELHISDPEYYEELYSRSSPRDKYPYYTNQFGNPESTFSTVHHQHHRLRRGAMNPFFSKRRIAGLEEMISSMVEKLCIRIEEFRQSGQPIPMRLAYMCLTTDVITKYSMARSWDHLESPDFSPIWCETIKATAGAGVFMKHFPWLFPVVRALPDRLVAALNPGMLLLLDFQRSIERQIKEIMDRKGDDEQLYLVDGQPTIFHELLNSDLPLWEKSLERLWQEGQVVVGAGADTTANALTVTTFHLLDNPDKLQRLKSELEMLMPDLCSPVKLRELEQLPYMSAVLSEGLRLSYGVSSRLQRIAPAEELKFHDWTIPPGTPVGMTSVLMHHNPSIFPNPDTFLPERWLEPAPDNRPLDRYLVSFTKGSRQCIGIKCVFFLPTLSLL